MSDSRTYVVGLPVIINISEDGVVSIDVDLSELSDLRDTDIPTTEDGSPLYTDEQVDLDAVEIQVALEDNTLRLEPSFLPFFTNVKEI